MNREAIKKRARATGAEHILGVAGAATAAPSLTSISSSNKKKKGKKDRDDVDSKFDLLPVDASEAWRRPPGLFEFPWQKGGRLLVPELDGLDLLDVFFSSLVDGCSAAVGFPGDRFSPGGRGTIGLPEIGGVWPSDVELDGADCIWSSVLR